MADQSNQPSPYELSEQAIRQAVYGDPGPMAERPTEQPAVSLNKQHHITRRYERPDGKWVTECSCKWESKPANHREALGWACEAYTEALYAEAYACGFRNGSCPDNVWPDLNARARWARGRMDRMRQDGGQ